MGLWTSTEGLNRFVGDKFVGERFVGDRFAGDRFAVDKFGSDKFVATGLRVTCICATCIWATCMDFQNGYRWDHKGAQVYRRDHKASCRPKLNRRSPRCAFRPPRGSKCSPHLVFFQS
jgi:hypothetical protein